MSDLSEKVEAANQRRSQFFNSLEEVKTSITLPSLAKEAANVLIKEFHITSLIKKALTKHPFLVSLVIAGTAYLAGGAFQNKADSQTAPNTQADHDAIKNCNKGEQL